MSTLICLPFAGGNLFSYTFLQRYLPSSIEVKVLEYPGHGRRINSLPLGCLDSIADDAFQQLRTRQENDYSIYGHSMGACVAYLLAERLVDSILPPPKHIFLSGHGLITRIRKSHRHLLPTEQFFSLVAEMKGTPPEVLACEELLEIMEPILRADFASLERYQRTEFSSLSLPLTVFHGVDDPHCTSECMRAWQDLFHGEFNYHEFSGGHFFIHEHAIQLAQLISETVLTSSCHGF